MNVTPGLFSRTNTPLLFFLFLAIALGGTLSIAPSAAADEAGDAKPLLIQGGRILTMAGVDFERGDLFIRKGRVAAVAPRLRARRGVQVIDASGKTVVPGFIDACSALLREPGGRSGSRATCSVIDAINTFSLQQKRGLEAALARGVTTVAVFPQASSGVGGYAAALRLIPDAAPRELVVEEKLALHAAVGLGSYGRPFHRLGEIENLRGALRGAKEYEEALENYTEELEEYEKKLKERAEKDDTEDQDKETDTKKNGNGKRAGRTKSRDNNNNDKKAESATKNDAAKDKDKDELKKPKKPRHDPAKERLLEALDGEIPLFVEVHRAADVINLLDIVEAYPVKLVLIGCTEGFLVTSELAGAGVKVVAGPAFRETELERNEFRNHVPWFAAALAKAEIPFALASSGRLAGETRHLTLNAAQTVAHGLTERQALEAITIEAARLLGLDERLGSLEKGKDADLVIFDGDPLSSAAKVEMVIIQGRIVYQPGA